MCGIAGFCSSPANWRENIERMNRRMYHRGPDGGGVWASSDAGVVLGHRRLSIVDLSENGAQPMCSASGRYVCAFNGEIYNYRRLRDKLLKEKKGRGFPGNLRHGSPDRGGRGVRRGGDHQALQGHVCHGTV